MSGDELLLSTAGARYGMGQLVSGEGASEGKSDDGEGANDGEGGERVVFVQNHPKNKQCSDGVDAGVRIPVSTVGKAVGDVETIVKLTIGAGTCTSIVHTKSKNQQSLV